MNPFVETDMHDNTACEGSDVTLKAVGLDDGATINWLVSDTENGTYTNLGKTGETITVEAILTRKYYKATDGVLTTTPAVVLGVVCCNATTSSELWSENFGTVDPWTRESSEYVVPGLAFHDFCWVDAGCTPTDPLDTDQSTLANGRTCWTWPSRVSDGNYAVASNSSYLNVAVPWKGGTRHSQNSR